jgi:hypothetical protein
MGLSEERSASLFKVNLSIYHINEVFHKIHDLKPSKAKSIPLQAWTGPEGSRKQRLSDLKTIGTLR